LLGVNGLKELDAMDGLLPLMLQNFDGVIDVPDITFQDSDCLIS